MKNQIRIILLRIAAISVTLFALGNSTAFAASGLQIAIVKSSDNSYFNKTIQALINHADKAVHFRVIDISTDEDSLDFVAESELVISLGLKSAQLISSRFADKNLISAYLTRQQIETSEISADRHNIVLLDQPLLRYLTFSHLLLNSSSIGLINYDPVELDLKQRKYLLKHGLELNQIQSREPDNLLAQLRRLIRQNSSLLMLPDQRIYNRMTLKGVLLTTYRSRTPVISYSPAHVKSGALASIYSSPENIGRHLGDLLNEFTKGALNDSKLHYARYYSITTNARVAHALGITLPETDEISVRLEKALQ